MAQGGADIFRPRGDTAQWSAAGAAGCVVLAGGTGDASFLFPGVMLAALWLQCRQRLEREGRFVRRVGLRPVTLDLTTAEVVCPGGPWWRELFLLGPSLQLRDAEGHLLYLESWLWDAPTRAALVEAAGSARPS